MRTARSRWIVVVALAAGLALTAASALPAAASGAKYPLPKGGNGGSTDVGVTANSIKLALVYSVTGPAPGVTAGALRGASAYVKYIDSIGGIYGRKLSITPFDDGFDPTKAEADCNEILPGYFAITGGFSIGDSGCYSIVKTSGIPWFQFFYDSAYEALPNAYFPGTGNPNFDPDADGVALHHLFPKVKKVALLYEETPGNSQETAHIEVGLKAAGFQVVMGPTPLSDTIPSYANYVVQLRDSGAQAIFMDASSSFSQSRLALEMAQQKYHPTFVEATTSYASNWHQIAGAGAAGWTATLPYLPFLDNATMNASPAGKTFLTWFNKTNPGKTIDLFAVFGWSSTALLVQAMIDAGPHLTRKGVVAAAKKIGEYSAGGVYAPSNIGQRSYTNCAIVMESTATGYKQLLPSRAGQFDCSIPGAKVIPTPGVPS